MPGKRNQRVSRRSRGAPSLRKAIRKCNNGIEFTPRNPPAVVYNPWNPAVLVVEATNTTGSVWNTLYTAATAKDALTHQIMDGVITQAVFSLRIRSVKAWFTAHGETPTSITAQESASMVMTPISLLDDDGPGFKAIVCTGSGPRSARTGFVWPQSHQLAVLKTSGTRAIVNFQLDGSGTLRVYLEVVWKYDSTQPATVSEPLLSSFLHNKEQKKHGSEDVIEHPVVRYGSAPVLNQVPDEVGPIPLSARKAALITQGMRAQ